MQNEDLGKYVAESSPKTPYLNSLKLAEAIKKWSTFKILYISFIKKTFPF